MEIDTGLGALSADIASAVNIENTSGCRVCNFLTEHAHAIDSGSSQNMPSRRRAAILRLPCAAAEPIASILR
jgi:hypothetical protein